MYRAHAFVVLFFLSSGCPRSPGLVPRSQGEEESGYTYIPIDPFRIDENPGDYCYLQGYGPYVYRDLLESLPDNSVRMLVEQFDSQGNVTYGPIGKGGGQTGSYKITLDYINADTVNVPMRVLNNVEPDGGAAYVVSFIEDAGPAGAAAQPGSTINIPVYIGIGLRISATVEVIQANASISGLGVIGAEAEANRLRGTLVVQTLGINGKSVSAALPIQSELNRTTAQNAIVAVGAIKALLYAKEDTTVSPRVVGLYLPMAGGKPLVNAIISALSSTFVKWYRPCPRGDAGPPNFTAQDHLNAPVAREGSVNGRSSGSDAGPSRSATGSGSPRPGTPRMSMNDARPAVGPPTGSAREVVPPYVSCQRDEQCAEGYLCVDDNGDRQRSCKPTCSKNADCAANPFAMKHNSSVCARLDHRNINENARCKLFCMAPGDPNRAQASECSAAH